MPKAETHISRLDWSGRVVAVQPRIRLMRSFDERHHSYQGYVLRIDGRCGDHTGEFLIAVGKGAHEKHRFCVGMDLSGFSIPVDDPRLEAAGFYKTSGIKICKEGRNRNIWDTAIPGSTPRPGNLSQQRPSPTGHQDLREEMHNLHLGLPDAGRNDHRPLESVSEAVPVRDLLLRAEKLFPLPGRGNAQGARAKRHVLHRRRLD